MTSDIFAPAKVNLTLHVTGQRADGYHLLDSLVVFADVGDTLRFEPAPEMSMTVTGPFAEGVPADARNLVWKAAVLAGATGHITLVKNLPHGAGIGGGSSDAAALLTALGATDSGLSLGADVPVCRLGRAARMRGIGGDVTALKNWPALHAVLANPGVHVPTPAVFKAMTQKENPPMPDRVPDHSVVDWLAAQRNDMQAVACSMAPEIGTCLSELEAQSGVRLVRMSGSGATCFALFDTRSEAESAAGRLQADNPDWWVVATTLS